MRTKLSLLAVTLWVVSLFSPVINDLDADQPGYDLLFMSFWGALYLWALPWVFLNVTFFILLYKNLKAKPNRELIEIFFLMLILVTLIEIGAELFARSSGIAPLGIWRYGAMVWTVAMALMGLMGLRVETRDKEERIRDEQRPPNKALQRSAGSAVLTLSFIAAPAPAERRRWAYSRCLK